MHCKNCLPCCFDANGSRRRAPPGTGIVTPPLREHSRGEPYVAHTTISMHAFYEQDGIEADGYLSRPTEPGPWPAVVVLHEWWGLDPHFRKLSRRLAAEGYVVLVPDLYNGTVTSDEEEAARLKTSLDTDRAASITTAAVPYLRSLPFVSADAGIGLLGFCMGGGVALLAAGSDQFDAMVTYFPSMYPDDEELRRIDLPILVHYGTDDVVTPRYEIDRILEVFEKEATPYERYEYEGAGHAFTNDTYEELYVESAAQDAWPRTVEFLESHLRDVNTTGDRPANE